MKHKFQLNNIYKLNYDNIKFNPDSVIHEYHDEKPQGGKRRSKRHHDSLKAKSQNSQEPTWLYLNQTLPY